MKRKWKNPIPRPVRAILCAVCAIALAIAYYIALGCPTLTDEQEFRRAEKIHLVGPSKIVDTLTSEYSEFDKMIVGETEYGICFFGKYTYTTGVYNKDETDYRLFYAEKTGDLTLVPAPNRAAIHRAFLVLTNLCRYTFSQRIRLPSGQK